MAVALYLVGTAACLAGYVLIAMNESWRIEFLKASSFLVLSVLPAWLYFRFLQIKVTQVYEDYVLALHRLGVDDPEFLPRPPEASIYYKDWVLACGSSRAKSPNIYQDKFDGQYGRRPTGQGEHTEATTACLTVLLPVAVVGLICAIGWGSILLDPTFLDGLAAPTAGDVVRFGFLGAYTFVIQMLVRRYLQHDLRPGTYVNAGVRFITVFVLTFVIASAWPTAPSRAMLAAAFIVGFFPIVGMQWLRSVATVCLRHTVRTLQSPYPLSALDGVNVWYEAQLLEVGVEDMQNLMTANMVDIILTTRVPIGRLVDWIDQSALLVHLPGAKPNGEGPEERRTLRSAGVRCATELEAVFPPPGPAGRCPTGEHLTETELKELRTQMTGVLDAKNPSQPSTVLVLLQAFRYEPNLALVRSWREDWRRECKVPQSEAA
jgi:hypothetical protein